MYVNLIFLLVFAAVFASTVSNGLWSNLVLLINVVSAGLVASNYYEPVAGLFDELMPSWAAAWEFVSVWVLFSGSMALFSVVTDFLSRTKVRFLKPIDQAGGIFVCCWISWVAVCFTTFTLHMAPLPRNFAGGDFQPTADAKMFFGLAPDHKWLSFISGMSRCAYYRDKKHEFDPGAEFIYMYAQRRLGLEKGGSWAVQKQGGAAAAPAAQDAGAPAGNK